MKKRIFISGSTRGIGLSIAQRLLTRADEVVIHGRAPSSYAEEALINLQQKAVVAGKIVRAIYFDVADQPLAHSLLSQEITEHGAFWGVVCNAGIVADGPFAGLSYEDWDSVIKTNLYSFYHITQPLLLPLIRLRNGGRIVVVSSLAGVVGNRGQVNYSASKAALIGAVKALARELASRHITVNAVAPGPIETEMLSETVREELLRAVPMNRLGTPEEVAYAVDYFFDPLAGFVTGHTLTMGGGIVV